jgi:hypothetical protein
VVSDFGSGSKDWPHHAGDVCFREVVKAGQVDGHAQLAPSGIFGGRAAAYCGVAGEGSEPPTAGL